jgi:hypothetical protein
VPLRQALAIYQRTGSAGAQRVTAILRDSALWPGEAPVTGG